MFKCAKCESNEEQIAYLREELRKATDRLLAVSNITAYQAVSPTAINTADFYGHESDEQVEYGVNGQKIIVSKKQ